jgi:hypothetical protein
MSHACPDCGKTFGSPSALGPHRRIVHGYRSPGRDHKAEYAKKTGKKRGPYKMRGIAALVPSAVPAVAAPPALDTSAATISSAVRHLADALIKFVLAEVACSLGSATAKLQPTPQLSKGTAKPAPARKAKASLGSAPVPPIPSSSPARSEDGNRIAPNDMTDEQLKKAIQNAKYQENYVRAAELTKVLTMRERAANSIASASEES